MLNAFRNLPIFRRLFLVFFLAALIPDICIIVIFNIATQTASASQAGILEAWAIGGTAGSTLFVCILGYLMNLTITNPLRHLATLSRQIRRGDTSTRAQVVGSDEIAIVSRSINTMLDNIERLIQQVQGQHDQLQGQVKKLMDEVHGLGEGDLRIQAEVTPDSLGVLADAFNYMVAELSSLVIRVIRTAQEVEHLTNNAVVKIGQQVTNADLQLQQMTTAAQEVGRISNFSQQAAIRAQSLAGVAMEAYQTASASRNAVIQTTQGMKRIQGYVQDTSSKVQVLDERSQQITDIVEVIASIAHQTNRLALDAAIQAAMAGANGTGFGAVADDIRRLAERTKEQTTTIGRMVTSVREDIGAVAFSMRETERETSTGASLIRETETALAKIFGLVEQQAEHTESINQVVRDEFQALEHVADIVQQVSDSTQVISSSFSRTADEMNQLARLAQQLLASVRAFKLNENAQGLNSGSYPQYAQPSQPALPYQAPRGR